VSYRLMRPRRISAYEARLLRHLLQVGANSPPSETLLASIEKLIVREEGAGGFEHDSLDFASSRGVSTPIAGAIGLMANGEQVELVLWARGDTITYLELDPFAGALRPIRMPILESIHAYPENAFGSDACEDTPI
jgi:hypothetical protein